MNSTDSSNSSAAAAPSTRPIRYVYGNMIKMLDESSPRAQQPTAPPGSPPVGIQLRPHQLALLARCQEYETGEIKVNDFPIIPRGVSTTIRTSVGIIGDKAGAGKSYVILSMVLDDKNKTIAAAAAGAGASREGGDADPNNGSNNGNLREVPRVYSMAENRVVLTWNEVVSTVGITMLVIPHNLCSQWIEYINSFGGGLVVAVVSRTRHLAILQDNENMANLDLIVVTSTFYKDVTRRMRSRQVRRLIIDESDSIAIPNCHVINASFCWFVTASYQNLLKPRGVVTMNEATQRLQRTTLGLSSSGYIRTLFEQLDCADSNRACAEALVVKNRDEFVDASITLPDPVITMVRCQAPRVVSVLTGFVSDQVMQHLNAGDIDGAIQHINPNNRHTEDNLIGVLLDKLEREVHNFEVHLTMIPSLNFPTDEARIAETTRVTARRNEVRARMNGIRERVKGSDACSICLNDIDNKTIVPCCSNAFCFSCISRWVATRNMYSSEKALCPLCKKGIGLDDILIVREGEEQEQEQEKEPASSTSTSTSSSVPVTVGGIHAQNDKLKNFEALLRERCSIRGQNKMLVFSSFDNSFDDIIRVLATVGVRWRFLKGNVTVISSILREYRTGTLDVLLVNSNFYGSGLNLENTSDLVLWHKSDRNIEHQIIGRAQRSGRTSTLKIWYMVHDNEAVST